jgi:hypothetical protein
VAECEHIRAGFPEELAKTVAAFCAGRGLRCRRIENAGDTPLIQERLRLCATSQPRSRFLLRRTNCPNDSAELIPQKGDAAMAATVLERARES